MESPAQLDGGVGWRTVLAPELASRGIFVFDPTREEINKIGMSLKESMDKLDGWVRSGHREEFKNHMELIWRGKEDVRRNPETQRFEQIHIMGDLDYVNTSDFLIFNYNDGDRLGGTIGEAFCAWEHCIPIYLVTKIPLSNINKSILAWVLNSGNGAGDIFANKNQLLEFLDKKYNLTKEKE